MTEIEMLVSAPVSPDGLRVEQWTKGSTHQVSDDLLRILIDAGYVAIVERDAVKVAPENKALGAAPENKRRGRKRAV